MKKLLVLLVITFAASSCSYLPTFWEDGSWGQDLWVNDHWEYQTGCAGGLCEDGGTPVSEPEHTVVIDDGSWVYENPLDGTEWYGCIHGRQCHTEALENPIPWDNNWVEPTYGGHTAAEWEIIGKLIRSS